MEGRRVTRSLTKRLADQSGSAKKPQALEKGLKLSKAKILDMQERKTDEPAGEDEEYPKPVVNKSCEVQEVMVGDNGKTISNFTMNESRVIHTQLITGQLTGDETITAIGYEFKKDYEQFHPKTLVQFDSRTGQNLKTVVLERESVPRQDERETIDAELYLTEVTAGATKCIALSKRFEQRIEFRHLEDPEHMVYSYFMSPDHPGVLHTISGTSTELLCESWRDTDKKRTIQWLDCTLVPPKPAKGKPRLELPNEINDMCLLHHKGKQLLFVTDRVEKALRCYDTATGEPQWCSKYTTFNRFDSPIDFKRLSTDGRGHLFATDWFARVHMLTPEGGYVGVLLRTGMQGSGITQSPSTNSLVLTAQSFGSNTSLFFYRNGRDMTEKNQVNSV